MFGVFRRAARAPDDPSGAVFVIRKTGPECRPEPVLDVAMVVRSAVVHQRDQGSARQQPVDIPALVPSGRHSTFRRDHRRARNSHSRAACRCDAEAAMTTHRTASGRHTIGAIARTRRAHGSTPASSGAQPWGSSSASQGGRPGCRYLDTRRDVGSGSIMRPRNRSGSLTFPPGTAPAAAPWQVEKQGGIS